uniref:Uncharacterized protein n=1 Tax=Manihot esculenta TaxID=3983 RepID=A0A2C9W7B5_MANES
MAPVKTKGAVVSLISVSMVVLSCMLCKYTSKEKNNSFLTHRCCGYLELLAVKKFPFSHAFGLSPTSSFMFSTGCCVVFCD